MINEAAAKDYISQSVSALYQTLQQGMDVSPGDRLRLEGQVDLLLSFDLLSWEWLEHCIDQQYEHCFRKKINRRLWQWMKQNKRFHLPCIMQEAPVYKS